VVGQTLAHYQITRKIGAGGMGEVYRATDSKLHRDVAIKVISAEYARDPDRMARFEREAQVLASLSHGSIAAVYGLEDAGASKALVMELVEGEDLSERLRRGALPVDQAIHTAAQIAEALEVAHEHGIIHRDLKPANVKLLPDGKVKLLDFGLAKALEDAGAPRGQSDTATISLAATRAGIILGTAAYMSPEQATGGVVDKRSDVWSFGVVLFEMLVGKRLFEGETTSHTIAEVIRAEIDFSRLPPSTPAALRTLLERCLERDPRRRLRDIREARLALERIGERGSGESMAGRVATGPVAAAKISNGRGVALWAGAAALAGALLAGAGVWLARGAPPASPTLRMDARFDRNPIYAELGPGFAFSPDGQRVAFVSGTGDADRRLIVRRLDQLDSTTFVTGNGADQTPYHPFFSPDGAWVGYVTPTALQKIPVSGGTPLMVCPVNRSRGATWTSDDRIVIAPGGNSGLQIVAASGGTPKDLTTLDTAKKEATHRWPQALPGDKFVLFTSHIQATGTFDQATIEVVELATGNRKVVYRGGSYGRYVPSGHLIYANSGTLFAVPFDLGRMEVTGTPVPVVQDVTSSPAEGAAQFAFSDTGLLGYLRGGVLVPEYPIVRVDRSGAVSALLDQPGAYASPRFSPDGRRLALTVLKEGNFDVWVYDLERHVLTRLTFSEDTDTEQIWSPDGSELAFGSNRGHKATTLFRKPSDGSGEEQVIAPTDVDVWPTSWSPDGKHIAFSASRKTFDVGVVALGAKPEYQWPVATGFVEIDPAFSPDGRWIAYTSNESGQSQIYVRPFPSGTGRWQISDSPGGYPRWSRDGRELFYRSDGGIMVAAIEPTGAGLRTGKPQLLFKGNFRGGAAGLSLASNVFADYDVAPDGRSFVMFPSGAGDHGDRAGLVTLVTNWFDELKRVSAR
jgi:serine/threonine-protein kinase